MVNRSVIITGGLGGIGLAVARAFAAEGASLLLLDRKPEDDEQCQALICEGAAHARSLSVDLADELQLSTSFGTAIAEFGRVDVVVNVAGAMLYKPIAEHSGKDWRSILDINLIGPALLIAHAFRVMKSGGCIVNVASVHARRTSPLVASYAASKAALVSLTRSASIEGKELGIRVNAILPGAIDTPLLWDSPNIKSGAEVIAPRDIGRPEDVAAITLFLASDAAKFITGEDIVADGGRMGTL